MRKVIQLTNNDLIIGTVQLKEEGEKLLVLKPYTVMHQRMIPYKMDQLMQEMDNVELRAYDVMWMKDLSKFEELNKHYTEASSSLVL